jgi:hypothetical protein
MYNTNMPVKAKKKNPAAVALGRKGGKKGGPARAAKLTPAQRSDIARKAVQARWAKSKAERSGDYIVNKGDNVGMKTFNERQIDEGMPAVAAADTSDHAFLSLLKQYKATDDPTTMRELSEQIERMIFHKQYENVKA